MVTIKTPEEINIIRQGGKILAEILAELVRQAMPGVKTIELDKLAEELMIKKGGVPAFKNYRDNESDDPFPTTICASVNNQLVHGRADEYELKEGDILSIDIGIKYPGQDAGYFTDMAVTIPIGRVPEITQKLLLITEQSLYLGIKQVKAGNRLSDISKAIQKKVEDNGFSVVRQLVGHGVGYQVHEDPKIPNYYDERNKDLILKEGMVLAIEPMVNVGKPEVITGDDGWTVITVDGSLCAHFEHTVAVTKDGAEILTQI